MAEEELIPLARAFLEVFIGQGSSFNKKPNKYEDLKISPINKIGNLKFLQNSDNYIENRMTPNETKKMIILFLLKATSCGSHYKTSE